MTLTPELQQALIRYLLTIGDDELVLGSRDSEWTGVAPMVEEDVAFSSLAQDEIGHARLCYILAAELSGGDADAFAFLRPRDQFYHARVLEDRTTPIYDPEGSHQGHADWAKAVARRFLYDLFDALRVASLIASAYEPLAGAMQKVQREERYHLWHGEAWWQTLAGSSPESHVRLEHSLRELWPGLLGLFEEAPGEHLLQDAGILLTRTSQLLAPWLERVQSCCQPYNLPFPAHKVGEQWQLDIEPLQGGRQGQHGSGWDDLYAEMTMVRSMEPEGVW
jgi:ring-1,2-phenylacetyl-CoA epoxidase subunit PaaC